jgi:hypothetical protein
VLGGPVVGQPHERRRGEVGHVGDDRDERVVVLGGQGHHVGTEVADHAVEEGEGGVVGGGRGREDPHGTGEEVGVGPGDALLLRAGHRVAAHEAGVVDGLHDRGLDAAHVGDHAAAGGEGRGGRLGHGTDRRGDEGDLSGRVDAHGIDRAHLQRGSSRRLVGVGRGDVPPGPTQRHPDGPADQPGPDEPGPAHYSGRSSRRVTAPWR